MHLGGLVANDVAQCTALQAEAEYKHNGKPVRNMHAVVNMSVSAVQSRWRKYEELFESVKTTVSYKFHSYMHRRGHQVIPAKQRTHGKACSQPLLHFLGLPVTAYACSGVRAITCSWTIGRLLLNNWQTSVDCLLNDCYSRSPDMDSVQ